MRAPAAAYAEQHPPSCLSGFGHVPVPLAPGGLNIAIDFKLRCQDCSSDIFQISAFPLVAPDPSPYSGVRPGQTLYRPPHTLKCVSCNLERPLFDVRTQGYDGVLIGGGAYESGTEGKAFIPGRFHVVVSFIYNIDLTELEELAGEARVGASDLFDWISIVGTGIDGGQNVELGYECA